MRAAVVFSSQSPGSFREVNIGLYSLSKEGQWVLPPEVFQQLMRTVLSPSSLETLNIGTGSFASPLDHIETISDSLTVLTFNNYRFPLCFKIRSPSSSLLSNISQQPIPNVCIKGGTKLSHILRENTSLRVLKLRIPALDRDEVRDIVHSLEDNHSLEELWLSEDHSHHLSESERQALEPRIHFLNTCQ